MLSAALARLEGRRHGHMIIHPFDGAEDIAIIPAEHRRAPVQIPHCPVIPAAEQRGGNLGRTGPEGRDVCRAAVEGDVAGRLELERAVVPVRGTRGIGKAEMKLNDALPRIEVDPETYEVRADGELLTCEPASELPLAQLYFLY